MDSQKDENSYPKSSATDSSMPASESSSSQSATEPDIPTFDEAWTLVAQWTDISLATQRGLVTALNKGAAIAGADPRSLLLSCEPLNGLLFRKPPSAHGMTPQRFGQVISNLRCVMRRLDLHAPDVRGPEAMTDAWRAMRDLLARYRQSALARFMGYCSLAGVTPKQVSQDTLTGFAAWLRMRTLTEDINGLVRATASNWTWARTNVQGWPQAELVSPNMRQDYTLPLKAYSQAFQDDVDRYLNRLAGIGEDPFSDDVFGVDDGAESSSASRLTRRGWRPLAPRSVETRRYQIRQAAAALVDSGLKPEALTGLHDLIRPFDRAKTIISFFYRRAGKKATAQTSGIHELLRQIAVYHVGIPDAEVARIASWRSRVVPPTQGQMTEKNRTRLIALLAPAVKAKLLHLPDELFHRASMPGQPPKEAARLAAYGLALAILLVFPMRRENLAGLRLDKHLMRLGGNTRAVTHIQLSAEEVKNRQAFHWPLTPDVSALIDRYLKHHRPSIADAGNPFLFVGSRLTGRSAHELAVGLSKLVSDELGAEVNVHLMRHFAVALFLFRNPGQYEVARQILGHRKVETTIRFYAGLEADAAARHFGRTVLDEKQQTKTRAAALLGRTPRKSKSKKGDL